MTFNIAGVDWQTGRLTLRVVALGPVVAGPGLAEHEVVGPEDPTVGAGPDTVHGTGLQVNQDCSRNKFSWITMLLLHQMIYIIVPSSHLQRRASHPWPWLQVRAPWLGCSKPKFEQFMTDETHNIIIQF